jgi:hypothetical protein
METEVFSLIRRARSNAKIERIYIIWLVSVEEGYRTGHPGAVDNRPKNYRLFEAQAKLMVCTGDMQTPSTRERVESFK